MKITWKHLTEIHRQTPIIQLHWIICDIYKKLHEFPIDLETHRKERDSFEEYLYFKYQFRKTDICTLMIIYDIDSNNKLLTFLIKAINHTYNKPNNAYCCEPELIAQMYDTIPKELKDFAIWHHSMSEPFDNIVLKDLNMFRRSNIKIEDKIRLILEKATIDAILSLQHYCTFLSNIDKEACLRYIIPNQS